MMTGRWIVLCGPDHGGRRQLETRAAALGLVNRCETRGFTLLADKDLACMTDAGGGVAIIGRLFDRRTFERIERLDTAHVTAIASDPGTVLRDGYWGGYLAVIGDPRTGDTRLLRDPSGAVPLYWTKRPSLWLATGDAQLLGEIGQCAFAVDYAAVAARLLLPGYHCTRTGLEMVDELLPGQVLTLGRRVSVTAYWCPWKHVTDIGVSPPILERVIDRTVDAMASCHRRILVTVSGGLDSSILACSLARQHHAISLLTIATSDPRGDERGSAGLLADALDHALSADFYDHADIDIGRSSGAHQPWPSARTFAQGYDRRRQVHALANGADAIFSGDGGDNIFCLTMSANPVVDRLRAEGLAAAMRTAGDVARLTSCSLPAVWRRTISRLLGRRNMSWPRDQHFLSRDAVEVAAGVPGHPWLDADIVLPPGKRAHIAALMRTQRYQHAYAPGAAEAVLPLLAQPIVEACLSIPSWRWCEGGENRAVARAAFADRLPPEIIHRRNKGGPDSFCVEIVERHRSGIREQLMDGLLAEHGLLDRAAIELSFARGDAERADVHRILALVDTEAWARSWSEQPPKVPR